MVGKRLDVEADSLLAGKGVQIAANRVHLAGDMLGAAGARSLEEHVLHKMADAVGLGWLAPGAGLDPYPHGHGSKMIHAFGQYDQPVRQYGASKISLSSRHHRFDSIVGQLGAYGLFGAARER